MPTSDRQPDATIDPDTGLPTYVTLTDVLSKVVLTPAEAAQFLTNLTLIAQDTQSDANLHIRSVAASIADPATYEVSRGAKPATSRASTSP